MNALTSLLVAEHLNDLMREAEHNRRAKLVSGALDPRVPIWRRLGARTARAASSAFSSFAAHLEPAAASAERQHRTDDRTPSMSA